MFGTIIRKIKIQKLAYLLAISTLTYPKREFQYSNSISELAFLYAEQYYRQNLKIKVKGIETELYGPRHSMNSLNFIVMNLSIS
jgi:hypothetical protein